MYSLRQLFKRTGGDQTARIVEVLKGTPNDIDKFAKALSNAVNFGLFSTIILWLASSSLRLLLSLGSDRFVEEAVRWLINFRVDCRDIEDALCLQKHAFNFIYLRRLKEACQVHIFVCERFGNIADDNLVLDGTVSNWYPQVQSSALWTWTHLTFYLGSLAGVEAKAALIFNDLLPKLAKQHFPNVIDELRLFSTKSNVIKCTNAWILNS